MYFTVLDLGLVFTASLGPRASTKVESHASFLTIATFLHIVQPNLIVQIQIHVLFETFERGNHSRANSNDHDIPQHLA